MIVSAFGIFVLLIHSVQVASKTTRSYGDGAILSRDPQGSSDLLNNCVLQRAPHSFAESTASLDPESHDLNSKRNFQITFRAEGEPDKIAECSGDDYLLDAAESAGMTIPYSCRAGACSTCAAKLLSGGVDDSEQAYLTPLQQEQGYILTCCSYPTSDCIVELNKEDEVNP
eukprot:Filipodium_phascolosomae@DN2047_c0_g1_i1.p1